MTEEGMIGGYGVKFHPRNIYDLWPQYSFLYTEWEKSLNWQDHFRHVEDFMIANSPWFPIIVTALYLVSIFGIRRLMTLRKAYDLKKPLTAWNFLLSAFSFMGAIRTVPHLLVTIKLEGFQYSVCEKSVVSYGHGACCLWTTLFIFSKFPELIDTYFIVLRKRPLSFLHWYHHMSVLLYCWHSFATHASTGLYFIAMNYTVHAIMYFYYACMGLGFRPVPPITITTAQLMQMFIGVYITYQAYLYKRADIPCAVNYFNLSFAGFIYASYALLFLNFFVRRFCLTKSKNLPLTTRKKLA